jgi:putative ATP-dependent endonuclease of the OLD family
MGTSPYCFLDHDQAAKSSFEKARIQGLLTEADVTFAICEGMKESEIEDMFELAAYEQSILNKFDVGLGSSPKFRSSKKWSVRIQETFAQQGKIWDNRIEMEVKATVAEAVASDPSQALNSHKRSAFDALVKSLETRLTRVPVADVG